MRKVFRFLGSMRFAMILLGVLIAACVAGSVVQQGKTLVWYSERYGERTAAAIVAFRLDDVFHSWWFASITAFLCLNLLLCNIVRFPSLLRRWRRGWDIAEITKRQSAVSACIPEHPEKLFAALRFRDVRETISEDGKRILYSTRGRAGMWGAWICHFGVLILILGFSLSQSLKEETSVYGVPGQTLQVDGTDYLVTIDDFRVELQDEDTVKQYTADLTVRNAATGKEESGTASVNHPARMMGMKFYQNSTGWAASVVIRKNGEELQREVICAGEYVPVKDKPELVIYLNAFYPDYALSDGEPVTLSSELRNPAYLYSVYYQGNIIGMNALTGEDVITIDEYTVSFTDPQTYTLIQIKRDRFTYLALAGGLVTLAGLAMALMLWPASMWASGEPEGFYRVSAESRKGGQLFQEEFEEAVKAAGTVMPMEPGTEGQGEHLPDEEEKNGE